jgi:aminoglycoside 6'-N-acetyltransferase I
MASEGEGGAERSAPGAEVRELRAQERAEWLAFRERLWPAVARAELEAEAERIASEPATNGVLVAALPDGRTIGFVEVALREWAEGCASHPVGYLEAWYVEEAWRRSGVGRLLLEAAERWARSRGCVEMGSDADPENRVSRAAHGALGFEEVGTNVLFRKRIAQ